MNTILRMATTYSFLNDALVPCSIFTLLGFLAYRHSGNLVSNADLIFSIGFLAFVFVANAVSFNSNKAQFELMEKDKINFEPMGKHSLGRGQFITKKSFLVYFAVSKIMGLMVPLIMIYTCPDDVAVMVSPSLFVLCAQAVAEQSTAAVHDVLRIAIPFAYTAYRLFGPLQSWAFESYSLYLEKPGDLVYASNCGLAWVNLIFAAYNLFVFLLLRTLPVYFDKTQTPEVEMAYTLFPLPKNQKKMKV